MPKAKPKAEAADDARPAIDFAIVEETEEEFWATARESLRDYRETGLHLTQEEVEEWMARRARGDRAPMPKPHT
ncbi:MAG: hypothetical protein HY834_17875 [Devosia nanyangense]|uniref:CopG family transcriptional regulator n=1 Tax=Devosia nanyangense TaxID=1228055 RepID=A0A933L5Z9_9HYPH|nr:hypothetical protein [Devosia nanyangense]